ncbi:BCCT family transporter [Litorimonas sp. RW-G-Af-16]|uniref:BCCT family transporter n=1 Tax=Litorimonas sp. RW-G-Af-16 TaxID=3241168 RepID=UPI00390CA833
MTEPTHTSTAPINRVGEKAVHLPRRKRLKIRTSPDGFYAGFNTIIAITAKILIGLLIVWAASFPKEAGLILADLQVWSTSTFGGWYVYATAFYMVICLALAFWPKVGSIRLGRQDERPEFSRFSWFSMMFGAGIGVGMLTYSTAEPIFHFANNPDVIKGLSVSQDPDNVRNAYKWAMLHYGLTPWGCYGIVGLALAYFAFNRNQPLTFRSALVPLFGKRLSGGLGHAVDIVAILATVIGVSVTIGFGVSQFASGVFNITGMGWIADANGKPTLAAQVIALVIIMSASTASALSGVNKGIKWLSNINMGLSIFLLLFFVAFGATFFAFKTFFLAIWDYFLALPAMSVTVWREGALAEWQAAWSIFYWAWWIAFAPFVGLFLARVSRGRTIREFVLGAMFVPSAVGLVWFSLVGGTAVNLELSGIAQGAILNADISAQLYQTINLILSPVMAKMMSFVIVILLMTYLVTSADSAILVINTVASAGNESKKHARHILIWGGIFIAVVAALLLAGGMDALKSAMILGAVPFSIVMALMAVSLVKALMFDRYRYRPAKLKDDTKKDVVAASQN